MSNEREKTAEPEVNSNSLLDRRPTSVETDSACMYIHHGYGLLGPVERQKLRAQATQWLHAWRKVQEDTERAND